MKPGADIADTVNGQNSRPIIFSATMVRAILDGRKTQTRRVMKPQPEKCQDGWITSFGFSNDPETPFWIGDPDLLQCCPYGSVGDRLYLREAWATEPRWDEIKPSQLLQCPVWYAADDVWLEWDGMRIEHVPGKTRPSVHMPRWASRITLEITKVRVERLQEIREEDACQEGVSSGDGKDFQFAVTRKEAIPLFRKLWDSINGKGAWDANPWVWVLEFKRVLCGNVTESDSATGVSSPKSSFGAGQH